MEAPAPLNSNEKALAISVLVMGALVVLFSITTIGGAIYILATGKVMGSEMSRSFAKLGGKNSQAMDDMLDKQLARQAEVQKKWAPAQLGTEGAYVLAVIGAMVCAILAIARGAARKALGQLALAASGVRVAVAVVTFRFTNELMQGMSENIMQGMTTKSGQLSPEKVERVGKLAGGAMAGFTAVSTGCMAFIMCGYFALVAYVFLAPKKT